MMKIRQALSVLAIAAAATFTAASQAALNGYAALNIDGRALDGDTTMAQIGGIDVSSNHVEVYEYRQTSKFVPKGKKVVTGPVVLLKRLDGTSPLIRQALVEDLPIGGIIRLFDNDPDTGETRLRFEIEIVDGKVVGQTQELPDAFDSEQSNRPASELISIQPARLIMTDVINAVTY